MPDDERNPDGQSGGEGEEVLGPEWGAFQGFKPTEGLRMMQNMHTELAAENQKLRQREALRTPATPAEEENKPPSPPLSKPDLDAMRGDDREAAQAALDEYTTGVVKDAVDQRLNADKKRAFPTARARAKRDAAEAVRQMGGDFSKHEKTLDGFFAAERGMSEDLQVDPQVWVQAYVQLEGAASMKPGGDESPGTGKEFHVERPSPRSGRETVRESDVYEIPEEKRTHEEFDRVIGEKSSPEEWAAFRDDIKTVDDYEKWLVQQAEKKSKGRRR